jgi:oligopeptide transport system substrate-binding protein
VDREFITGKLLRAGQVPAYSFVPPGTANAQPGPATVWARKSLAARQSEARALLAQAGYGPGRPLKLNFKVATATDSLLLAQAVQADWRAVGVEASILQTEGQILFADLNARNFQVAFVSWIGDFNDPLTFLGLFQSSTGAQNYGDYGNPAYDRLLAAADQEPDAGRRTALLGQADQTLLHDEAIAPVYYGVSRSLVNPRVTGWVDNIQHRHRARWLCVRPAAAR